MAEESKIAGKVFGQDISVTTNNILALLVLAVAVVAGYLAYQGNDKRLTAIEQVIQNVKGYIIERDKQVDSRMDSFMQRCFEQGK